VPDVCAGGTGAAVGGETDFCSVTEGGGIGGAAGLAMGGTADPEEGAGEPAVAEGCGVVALEDGCGEFGLRVPMAEDTEECATGGVPMEREAAAPVDGGG